jgi:hypothetical protein
VLHRRSYQIRVDTHQLVSRCLAVLVGTLAGRAACLVSPVIGQNKAATLTELPDLLVPSLVRVGHQSRAMLTTPPRVSDLVLRPFEEGCPRANQKAEIGSDTSGLSADSEWRWPKRLAQR